MSQAEEAGGATSSSPSSPPPQLLPSVVAVEAGPDWALLVWDEVPDAVAYELQMGPAPASETADAAAEEWTMLSNALKTNMVRKKNLAPGTAYRFRVRARDRIDWNPFLPPAVVRTSAPNLQQMAAPRLEDRGDGWVAVAWEPMEGAEKYAVEMRTAKSPRWVGIGLVNGTSVKKKNLAGGKGLQYHFRVKPLGIDIDDAEWTWSPGSDGLSPLTLAPHIRTLLGSELVGKDGTKVPVEALAGKVVGVYASAHWCGPCRQFTPMLAQFYTGLKALGKPFEVVFASLDQEEAAFADYFDKMPWLALPFDGDEREHFMSTYQVNSIPRLIIFAADGRVLEDNAVGPRFLTDQTFDAWCRGQPASTAAHTHGAAGGCCGGGACK